MTLVLEQLTRLTQATQSMQYSLYFLYFICISSFLACVNMHFLYFNAAFFLFLFVLFFLIFFCSDIVRRQSNRNNFLFLRFCSPFLSSIKHMRRVEMHPAYQLRPLRGMDEVTTIYLR